MHHADSTSDLKRGCRVEARLGNSFVEGVVEEVNLSCHAIMVDGDTNDPHFLTAPWVVTRITPKIVDVEGTVVLDNQGDAWQRTPEAWKCIGYSYTRLSLSELLTQHGPLHLMGVLA